MVVVSGMRFEFYFLFLYVRACESEGTADVVVVSGTRFESFFYYYYYLFFFARTGKRERSRKHSLRMTEHEALPQEDGA